MKSKTPIIVATISALAVVVAALIPAVRDVFINRTPPGPLQYRGSVRDSATNLPVKDAEVIALGYTDVAPMRTDDFGTFKLNIPVSKPGEVTSIRLQVTHRDYQEFNRIIDLTRNEVETSLVLIPIARPSPSPTVPPRLQWPTLFSELASAEVQVSDVDDIMSVSVNGNPVIQATYGQTPPWVSILPFLRRGPNKIEVLIQNGQYGGCGGTLALRLNRTLNPDYRWNWSKQENQMPNVVCFQQVKTLDLE